MIRIDQQTIFQCVFVTVAEAVLALFMPQRSQHRFVGDATESDNDVIVG